MAEGLEVLLDSGVLYLAIGALICLVLGIGAVKRMFREASKAEPPPPEHTNHKHPHQH